MASISERAGRATIIKRRSDTIRAPLADTTVEAIREVSLHGPVIGSHPTSGESIPLDGTRSGEVVPSRFYSYGKTPAMLAVEARINRPLEDYFSSSVLKSSKFIGEEIGVAKPTANKWRLLHESPEEHKRRTSFRGKRNALVKEWQRLFPKRQRRQRVIDLEVPERKTDVPIIDRYRGGEVGLKALRQGTVSFNQFLRTHHIVTPNTYIPRLYERFSHNAALIRVTQGKKREELEYRVDPATLDSFLLLQDVRRHLVSEKARVYFLRRGVDKADVYLLTERVLLAVDPYHQQEWRFTKPAQMSKLHRKIIQSKYTDYLRSRKAEIKRKVDLAMAPFRNREKADRYEREITLLRSLRDLPAAGIKPETRQLMLHRKKSKLTFHVIVEMNGGAELSEEEKKRRNNRLRQRASREQRRSVREHQRIQAAGVR